MLSGEAAKEAFIARYGIPEDNVFQGIIVCLERGLMDYDPKTNQCITTELGKLYYAEVQGEG